MRCHVAVTLFVSVGAMFVSCFCHSVFVFVGVRFVSCFCHSVCVRGCNVCVMRRHVSVTFVVIQDSCVYV